MAESPFVGILLRVIADKLVVLIGLHGPGGKKGWSCGSFEGGDKSVFDQAVMDMIGLNYDLITAEFLAAHMPRIPMDFAQKIRQAAATPEN